MSPRPIREMPADALPREKALARGIKSLTDAELMALLFGTGMRGKSVVELCDEILDDHSGHLSSIARMSAADMCRRYKGIGRAKAISLLAALEVGARAAADAAAADTPAITSSRAAADIMRPHMAGLPHEEFWILLLSSSLRVIRSVCVSRGGIGATMVDVKIVLKHALDAYAPAMILCHNHPSGALDPSGPDDALTRRIADAARLLDIRVNDHIILTDASYYSYHDNGHIL